MKVGTKMQPLPYMMLTEKLWELRVMFSILYYYNNINNNNIAFILRKFHVYNMFKCVLHDTYNYTLNILRVLFGAFSCHSRNTGASPFSFYDKCPGFFYVHYTTHGTYSFTSHPKDEAIMVKCLAQGHKCHDRDSNPHSAANTRTWVR